MSKVYFQRFGTLQLKPTSSLRRDAKSAVASHTKIESAATFRHALEEVKIRRKRSPSTKESQSSDSVAKILTSDPLKDRAFIYTISPGSHTGATTVKLHNVKDNHGYLSKGRGGMTFNFGSNRKNADMILRAASTLARLLERWPHPLKFGTKSMRILADVALELASQRLTLSDNRHGSFKVFYSSSVNGIDPDSGKPYFVHVMVRPKNVTSFEVPETPETEKFVFRDVKHVDPNSVKGATVKVAATSPVLDEDRSEDGIKHEAAKKILRLVLWKYHSKILRLSDVEYAVEETILKYAANTQRSRGPYEGKPLYELRKDGVFSSYTVNHDTIPKLPSIALVDGRAPSALQVVDAIDSTWINSGDLKNSWLAGWETAQKVNKEAEKAKDNIARSTPADPNRLIITKDNRFLLEKMNLIPSRFPQPKS